MKTSIRIFMVFMVSALFSHPIQAQTFSKVYEDVANGLGISAYDFISSFDTAYLLFGSAEVPNYANITKVNQYGEVVWAKTYTYNDYYHLDFTCATPTYDSAFLFAGNINGGSGNIRNSYLMKIDCYGDTIWTATYGSVTYNSYIMSVEQTIDSGFVLTGYGYGNDVPNYIIKVLKTDKNGELEWAKDIILGTFSNLAYSVKQIYDTTYIVTGRYSHEPQGTIYSFIMNLSENGLHKWTKKLWNDQEHLTLIDFVLEEKDMVFLFETSDGLGLIKTDSAANMEWNKYYNVGSHEHFVNYPSVKVQKTFDGGYVMPYGASFFWGGLIKTDEYGTVEWHNEVEMKMRQVRETHDQHFLVLGNGPIEGVKGYNQMGLIKLDNDGLGSQCVWGGAQTGVEINIQSALAESDLEESALIRYSNAIEIQDNPIIVKEGCVDFYGAIEEDDLLNKPILFPNPNYGTFTIKNIKSPASISIYNALGKIVYQASLSSNQQTIEINSQNLGVYFYKVENRSGVVSFGRFVVVEQ